MEFSEELNEDFLVGLKEDLEKAFFGCKRIAVKVHFGEPGNETSLTPEKIRPFVDLLKEIGCEIFLYDSLVAYDSVRGDAEKHRAHAVAKGYGKLGEVRTNDDFVLKRGEFMDYEVSRDLVEADGVLVISHVKGHVCSGFGGAIKNLGMGAVTKNSKAKIHDGGKYEFDSGLCNGCGICALKCPMSFIKMRDGKPVFGDCWGCSNCCVNCPTGALKPKVEVFDKLLADSARTCERSFKRVYHLNIIKDITKECDCESDPKGIIAGDVGYVAGESALEVDKESYKRIVDKEGAVFLKNNKKNGDEQIKAFEELNGIE
jgi:hypothetical protein